MKYMDSGMSWKGYKSPEAPNAPDTGSSPPPGPCLLLLILAKSTPTYMGQGGPRACQLSGMLLLWAFSGRSRSNRLKKMSLQRHTRKHVHTHSTPAVSLEQGWCPSPTQVFLPFGEGAQGTQREGFKREKAALLISALGGHPAGLQNPVGTSPGTKEELPRPEAQRPASAPGTSTGAQHTHRPPHGLRSPKRVPVPTGGYSQVAGGRALIVTLSPAPPHTCCDTGQGHNLPHGAPRGPRESPGCRRPAFSAAREPRRMLERRRGGGGSGRLSHAHASVWALASASGGATPNAPNTHRVVRRPAGWRRRGRPRGTENRQDARPREPPGRPNCSLVAPPTVRTARASPPRAPAAWPCTFPHSQGARRYPAALLDSSPGEAQELPSASGAERPRSPQLPTAAPSPAPRLCCPPSAPGGTPPPGRAVRGA